MTAAAVLAELLAAGVRAYRVAPDAVRLIPKAAVTPTLLAKVRTAKPILLRILPPLPVPDYASLYATVAHDTDTAADLEAFSYFYDAGHRDLPEQLTALEADCTRLAEAGAPEADFRAAVERLVELVHRARAEYAEYRRARQPTPELATPASGGPLIVGIADPCVTCNGTMYHMPAVNRLVHCAHCNPKPSPRRQRRGAA